MDESSPWAVSGPPPGPIVRIDKASLSADSTVLTMTFVGGARFDPANPCTNAYAGWAEQVGDVLEATVVDVTPPHPPVACTLEGYTRSVDVTLATPFLGTKVHDRAGFIHFVRRPFGLVELRALPAGWVLRSENEISESPKDAGSRSGAPRVARPSRAYPASSV